MKANLKQTYRTSCAAAALCIGFWPAGALAQTAPAADTAAPTANPAAVPKPAEGEGSEIIVTAQRREQQLIDVPISIDVLGERELKDRKIRDLDDLALAAPGLSVQSGGNYSRRVFLRGLGNAFGNSPLIGLYLDEVPVASHASYLPDLQVFDLQRVEVLRGPQGTLYGDGSMGGTIRFITNDPDLNVIGGSVDAQATVTEDGSMGTRIQPVVNVPLINDKLGLRVSGLYDHGGGWIDQPAANRKNVNDQDLVNVRAKLLFKPTDRLKLSAMAIVHRNHSSPVTGEDEDGDFVQAFGFLTKPDLKDHYEMYNLTGTYDLGGLQLLSSSSYINQHKRVKNSGSHNEIFNYDFLVQDFVVEGDSFTQEVRLSTTGAGPFHGTFGGFYRHQTVRNGGTFYFGFSFPSDVKAVSNSWAGFADVSYDVSSRLSLGVGARYFEDHQTGTDLVADTRQKDQFHSFNPRFYGLYHVSDDVSLYASAGKGFRSGGFNQLGQPSYDPESIWTYDGGLKGRTKDGLISFDVAAFYSDYKDVQIIGQLPNGPPIGIIGNAGDAHLWGVEGGFEVRVMPGTRISASGNYVKSKFYKVIATNSSSNVGDPLNFVPKYAFTLALNQDIPLGSRIGTLRLDYNQQGPSTYAIRYLGPTYAAKSDVLQMFNADFKVPLNDRLTAGIFGQNLFNDRGFMQASWIEGAATRPRPRTYGVELGVRF